MAVSDLKGGVFNNNSFVLLLISLRPLLRAPAYLSSPITVLVPLNPDSSINLTDLPAEM